MTLMIGISAIAHKIRLPYLVLLIITRITIGFIPTMPVISLNPDIVFLKIFAYICYAFIITIVAFLLRLTRVFGQKINLQKAFQKKKKVSEHALLDFKSSLVIRWLGMRGIVSLAIAIGLPVTLSDGSAFPQRNAILFISVVVVLIP